MRLDQMWNDLGIGRRFEDVAGGDQPFLQFEIVFDDAVVYDNEAAGTIAMRVSILLRWPAMGRPAGMPDAVFEAGLRYRITANFLLERMDASNGSSYRNRAVNERSNSTGIVPTVFKPFQTVK